MARSYSQVTTAIWHDTSFRALTVEAQLTYLMFITQADITPVGTLPLTMRRWSSASAGMTIDRLSNAIDELESGRFVVVDAAYEEVLVRSFVKWDGGNTNPKRCAAIQSSAVRVGSPTLRAVLAFELNKVGVAHGITESPLDSHSIADGLPIDRPVVVVTERSKENNPQPTTHNPQPASHGASADPRKRGTRLPNDWTPSTDLIEAMRTEGIPDTTARRELPKFRDYWAGVAGAKGVKLDWDATWRNWLRRTTEPTTAAHPPTSATAKVQGWLALGDDTPPTQYAIGA